MATLKVFRTPIGFHDAYVAVPSQKAALKAWGADGDLFARGIAERVTDAALMEAPLSQPGAIIRVSRGRDKDHFEALAKLPSRKTGAARKTRAAKSEAKPVARKVPRPSRDDVDRTEAALDKAEAEYEAASAQLAEREAAIKQERARLRAHYQAQQQTLEDARDEARAEYQARIEQWAAR
jgi:multidrug resistance efflux pump